LLDAPDAFGSLYEEEKNYTDSEWKIRLVKGIDSETDLPLIVKLNKEPAGIACGQIEVNRPEIANLYQMWGCPRSRW